MSRKERERMTVLTGVKQAELTLVQAAPLLGLGYRRRPNGSGGATRPRATPG